MKTPYGIVQFQIGKNGLTETVLLSLDNALKNHSQVRVSVLKSSGRDKAKMQSIAKEIEQKLPTPVLTRVIGFTIIVKKGRPKNKSKV